jgi:hypothetical protein
MHPALYSAVIASDDRSRKRRMPPRPQKVR